MELHLEIKPHVYPDKPQKPVGKCYKHNNFFYYQRATDVLFVNTTCLIIGSYEVGFMEGHNKLIECSLLEFSIALNTTIFNMNILNGEFK